MASPASLKSARRKRRRIQNELAGNGERACRRMNHVCTHSRTATVRGLTRARANCRRLSVPFQTNPIIRNETASFYGLVQAYLFIRYARTAMVWGGNVRRASASLPLLILFVAAQRAAEHTLQTHVRLPFFFYPTDSTSFSTVPPTRSLSFFLSLSLSYEI